MDQLKARNLAKNISLITNPALIVTVGIVLAVNYYADTFEKFWLGSLTGVGLLVLPGLLYSVYIWRKEGVVDIDLSDRRDRVLPLLLSSVGAIIGSVIVSSNLNSQTFVEVSYILSILLVSLTVVTNFWKISLHTATIAGIVSILTIYRNEWFGLGYILLLPVAWSRLNLKQHSPNQLVGGAIVGTVLTYGAVWFFNR